MKEWHLGRRGKGFITRFESDDPLMRVWSTDGDGWPTIANTIKYVLPDERSVDAFCFEVAEDGRFNGNFFLQSKEDPDRFVAAQRAVERLDPRLVADPQDAPNQWNFD